MNDISEIKTGLVRLDVNEASQLWSNVMTMENTSYTAWKNMCIENRKFYLGDQWTETEAERIAARGQHRLTINKIRTAIRNISGMIASSIPTYRIVSSVGSSTFDQYITNLSNRIIEWSWQNSSGSHLLQRTLKKSMIDNIAYLHVYWSKERKIKSQMLTFNDVLVYPTSKDPMFADAPAIAIKKQMTIQQAKAIYNIPDAVMTTSTSYQEIPSTFYNIVCGTTNDQIAGMINVYEVYKKIYIYKGPDAGYAVRILKETLVGFYNAYREVLPEGITDYPIIPFYCEDTETPYKFGEVEFVKDLQRFINKAFGVVLFNAQQMSNPKVFVKQNDIPAQSLQTFADTYAAPGSVNILSPNAELPFVVPGQPLNEAFFRLYLEASMQLDNQTYPAQMNGVIDSKKMQESSELVDVKETVLDKYKDVMANIELALEQHGRVILQFGRAYLNSETTIILFGNPGDDQRLIRLNEPARLDPDDKQSVSEFANYMMQQGSSMEEIDNAILEARKDKAIDSAIQYYRNSTKNLVGYDVYVVTGSTTTSYKSRLLRLMYQMYKDGMIDAEEVIRHSPVENPDELIQKYGTIQRQKYEIEAKDEQIAELEQTVKKLSDGILESEKKVVLKDHEVSMYKIEVDARIKSFLEKKLQKYLTREQITQMAASLTVEVMKQKATAQKQIDTIIKNVNDGIQDPEIAKGILEHI